MAPSNFSQQIARVGMLPLPKILEYQVVEVLYSGSRTAVYRAVRTADQCSIAIKLLKNEHPTFNELAQFRNQYAITKHLEIPGIIQPYNLEPYHNGYALVMEDFGGISLSHFLQGRSLSLKQFWSIALQLTDILHSLHQQRIIHKDIKPANILIHPDTQQVKLIDFSIASLLPRETQEIQNPNSLEGTLAYLSPEQTGRMNRGIDYRSDFYSLGVTFFELLTGQLPFHSPDPMEMVHSHLAKQPPDLCDLNPELPLMLSKILCKLMAKNAEARYQSAVGLKYDLIKCQESSTTSQHSWFELGQCDVSDRFLIPEKLYGREPEVKILLEAFGRVANGASELMLIAGFSGIGKTAVVNEVHKPIARWNGYFIKGKYDQFNRNIPFSAFVQAFRGLMGQLSSESDEQLRQWRAKILLALGENGQVLIDVIPELEQIIGKQPSAVELSGSAAQNRFNLLVQKFIKVFATLEHPLVMFLDDLQWADLASLNLMQVLMNQQEAGYLLLIGAYRNNEVFSGHPLMLAIADLHKANATLDTLTLNSLSQDSLNALVADTLHCSAALAQPLTELLYQKTQGNPFFATQFLKSLYEEGYIAFNPQTRHWQCDIATVRSLTLTDDVVEFMTLQLYKLPIATQSMLKIAACIGAQFTLQTLALVSERSLEDTAADLWNALQEGLLLPTNQVYKFYQERLTPNLQPVDFSLKNCSYRFLHDRVQQAAYSLIPDDQKQVTHLLIGRLLQQATTVNDQDGLLFVMVNHLNRGASLLEDELEQQELAQLNLKAGHKAKNATAYVAALDYFNTGITLLRGDRWHHYDLMLALYEGATESAYLSTDFEQMEQLAAVVLSQARSWLDRSTVYVVQIQAGIAQNQHLKALQLARDVLEHLGVSLPAQPTQVLVEQALQHSQTLLNGRTIQSLLDLPEMTAPEPKAAMVILSSIISAAYQVAPTLLPLIISAQVNLSLQYGNAPESTYGYVKYGLILIAATGDIDTGYKFGRLGMNLLQRLNASRMTAKTIFGFHNFLSHWKEPAKNSLDGLLQAYSYALEEGDLEYASLSLLIYSFTAYFSGHELSSLKEEMEQYRQVMQQLRQDTYLHKYNIYYQTVLNLLEVEAEPDRLYSQHYDEDEMIQLHLKTNDLVALYQIYFNKLLLSYLFQRYGNALTNARLVEQYSGAAAGLIHGPIFCFYDALVQLAIYPTVSKSEQITLLDRVAAHQEKLEQWAVYAPSNQAQRCALVAAERCRVLGQKADAIDLYDRAIALAKENEYIQEEALANELAAKFYLAWGKERIAQDYMTNAYYGYAHWGAKAKIVDLEARYPRLLAPIVQPPRTPLSLSETVFATGTITSTSSSSSISDSLDLTTILKVSQTLSKEIELGRFLSTLLQLIIENAGADKCVLLLMRDDSLLVKGLVTTGAEPIVLQRTPVEQSQDVPLKLIYNVKNRLEPVLLKDIVANPEFVTDSYFLRQQPKSVLCSPILHQGKLLGIVYLENNLTIGAFTNDRIHVLTMLCAQAAISLENAQLYERSQAYAQQLERSLKGQEALFDVVCEIRRSLNADTIFEVVTQRVRQILKVDRVGIYQFEQATGYSGGEIIAEDVLPRFPSTLHVKVNDHCFTERYLEYYRQGKVYALSDLDRADVQACYRALLKQFAIKANLAAPIVWRGELWGLLCVHHCQQPHDWTGEEIQFTRQIAAQLSVALEQATLLSQTHQQATELGQALQNLQQTQLQLVQGEKMSALGNLVAGVAHEINNPVGFIAGNLQPALDYVNDMFGLLDLYQQDYPNPSAVIQAEMEAINLDYVREDLPKLIGSMKLGVDRIRSISTSLRSFSRSDKDYKVPFNIHEGIDSTILILKHRLKANNDRPAIDVITDYGTLHQIDCFPGQLNQVFMNILANAIDALEESNRGRSFAEVKANPNQITIQTRLHEHQKEVAIHIRDNGMGMTADVEQKIFEHLFTTKAVGEGTGLGLAIAQQIVVEKHSGSIAVVSAVGEGSEFIIRLPSKTRNNQTMAQTKM